MLASGSGQRETGHALDDTPPMTLPELRTDQTGMHKGRQKTSGLTWKRKLHGPRVSPREDRLQTRVQAWAHTFPGPVREARSRLLVVG